MSALANVQLDFIKGEALDVAAESAKGTPMVLEFWATWCPPCRQTIPHLTQLQKKYPDIPFIGVTNESKSVAAPFVSQQGAQMDYRVAADVNNSANIALMQKFGAKGIPTAFVIDRNGKVSWNGHPADVGFESALAAVQAQRKVEKNTKSKDELMSMSVKELKAILADHKISAAGCVEKADLVERVLDHCS
eukprot:TRINITY_DN6813_c0_g1_i1.p1 TRINITY_DN6813_c0_g1~~TRINITY_DN6813_c0_g1_i1.p1  ORF type:complete len:191 (+),score=29.63 TRINITY_DN6813_c0_g1_i1:210-782(+)